MSSLNQYIDLFHAPRTAIDGGSCAPMNARREAALQVLKDKGLPTQKTEQYKYTDTETAFAPDYGLNLHRAAIGIDPYATYRCNVPNLSTSLYFVVNDTPCPFENKTAPLAEGVVVMSLCQAAIEMPGLIEKYYHSAAEKSNDAVAALNTLLAQDGLFVYLPQGACPKHPVQIVNVSVAETPVMSNRRVLVVADKEAEATLLFCDHTIGKQRCLSTQVIEIFADEMAKINVFSIEETTSSNVRFNNVYVEQQAGSRVISNGVVLNCGLTRNTMEFRLLGTGAQMETNGAVITDETQHVDNNVLADHVAPNCTSDMLYKYVLDGRSTGAFAGKVLVRTDAQKTVSQQTNANLCASPQARVYSQPMLEIYADDVKCNHGSTIGKLDENALFYMRQRGVPEAEARLLLQHAFINDVLQRVTLEHLRDRLSHLVELRFRGELSKCRDCKMCR